MLSTIKYSAVTKLLFSTICVFVCGVCFTCTSSYLAKRSNFGFDLSFVIKTMRINFMKEENEVNEQKKPIIVRNSTDLQRLKLEKLMKNPGKPVIIPEKPKERGIPTVPDFVRNVMGSSAGAGSGEFHVYRHLRRKEYARQKYMKEKAEKEMLEDEYHQKLEENRRKAEERTEKKRLKRLKKKQKYKQKSKKLKLTNTSTEDQSDNESSGIESTEESATEDTGTDLKCEDSPNESEDKCDNDIKNRKENESNSENSCKPNECP